MLKQKKRKNKVQLKISDVTTWLTNNYNTHIAQYFTNYRKLDDEIWSVSRIYQEKYFSSNTKSHKKLLNKRDPKIDPWGTPNKISSHELYAEFILVL